MGGLKLKCAAIIIACNVCAIVVGGDFHPAVRVAVGGIWATLTFLAGTILETARRDGV